MKRIVEGDTNCLGYTIKELQDMSGKDLMDLYHPDSQKDGILNAIMMLSETTHTILSYEGIRVLKAKNSNWETFKCKIYFERDSNDSENWHLNAYCTHLKTAK